MAETPGLNADVGITLNRLTRQLAQAEARMIKAAKKSENAFQKSNRIAAGSFRQVDVAAARSLSNIERLSGRAGASIAGLARGGVAGLVATVGFAALQRYISGTVSELSNLGKEADRIGIAIEPLQGLQRGFELAGVEAGATTKGLEQFGKRVGEAANGTGTLAATFDRYGVSLRDSSGELRPQLDLLREFADVIQRIPNEAARLSAANEAFGRSGLGFVNALRGGGESLDRFISDAKEGGFVIEESLVRKAEDLDDRFADLTRRTKVFFQTIAVGAADGIADLAGLKRSIDDIIPDQSRQTAVLGSDIADALAADANAAARAEPEIRALEAGYDDLAIAAANLARDLGNEIPLLVDIEQTDAALVLNDITSELEQLVSEFGRGAVTAEAFVAKLRELRGRAADALAPLQAINGVDFSFAIDGVDRLGQALSIAIGNAGALRDAVVAASRIELPKTDAAIFREAELASRAAAAVAADALSDFLAGETERNAKSRERLDIERETAGVQKDALEAGVFLTQAQAEAAAQARIDAEAARAAAAAGDKPGSKPAGGGAAKPDAAAEEIKRQTEARRALLETVEDQVGRLELEFDLIGQSVENTARLTAQFELLNQAKRAGLDLDTISAETGLTLGAEIERQAAAVGALTAALEAKNAAQEFGISLAQQAVDGLIDQIVAGGDLAGVFQNLAIQIAKAAAQALLFGTGPLAGSFGSTAGVGLLGFASGGYTGDGGKFEPKGVVHGGEYVFSKQATQRIGVQNLERMHRQLRGYSSGGAVGAGGGAGAAPAGGGTTILNLLDPSIVGRYLRTPEGEKLIVNTMRENKDAG